MDVIGAPPRLKNGPDGVRTRPSKTKAETTAYGKTHNNRIAPTGHLDDILIPRGGVVMTRYHGKLHG